MLKLFFVVFLLKVFVGAEEKSPFHQTEIQNGHGLVAASKTSVSQHNGMLPYIEKDDNMLRIPNLQNTELKRKKQKKSPKRTVQKIIKRNKIKTKMRQRKYQTQRPTTMDYEKLYASDDNERTTTQTSFNVRKRSKKVVKKVRNQMPFHNLQRKERRHKRELSREVFILKDFDELQFLGKDNDYDVVRTNVKKPW